MTSKAGCILLMLLAGLVAAPMPASATIARLPVAFPAGATQAVAEGRIGGRDSADHVVRARAGQTLVVRMEADSGMAYFNVLPPGSDEAIFIGSVSGDEFRGVLAGDGDHVIRVYLMAAGARRGESSNYTLHVALTDPPAAPRAATE